MGITGRSPGESTPAVRTALVRPLDLARGGPMTNSSSSDKARLSGFWICAALVLGVFTTTARPRSDVVVAKSAANVRYDVRDLGPLPWVADDVLPNINDSGEVSFWRATADGAVHAFAVNAGSELDLGTLRGHASSVSRGLNARGEIVGWSVSGRNLVDSLATTHAFLYSLGRMLDLGTLGGRDSQATGINEAGQIVGVSTLPDRTRHAFLYCQGKLTDLGALPRGGYSTASGINRSGVIVGAAETAIHLIHAVVWTSNTIRDLGTLPAGTRSRAIGLNDKGEVVGFSEAEGEEIHGFLYANGVMRDLGSLGNDPIRANAINDRGQIVGMSGVNKYARHAFIWQDGKMEDLNRLVAGELSWRLGEAYDINNHGQILCAGTRTAQSAERRLLLLDPATKPSR
jgi:probable HAF family extracellular repeat protein